VWLATNAGNKVYLGGTIHMLRASDFPLPSEFDVAYAESDSLYFETDIDAMNNPATQLGVLQQLMYSDGRTLASVLNQEAYTLLSDYAATLGLPMMLLQNMKPGMLVSTLELMEFQKLGFTPQGVDMTFHQQAKADGKVIGSFETVQEQIGLIANMGEGEESEFMLLSLRDMEKIETDIESMIHTWRTGDADSLMNLFVNDMKLSTPAVYQMMLSDRNNKWLLDIEAMLEDSDTEFILVGVAHLVGQDGLVQQLRARGYQVEQL
tara:strand:+ start:61084 stop:61875 length:792 start_codon:yes stop_codon:yes gene_type:complete